MFPRFVKRTRLVLLKQEVRRSTAVLSHTEALKEALQNLSGHGKTLRTKTIPRVPSPAIELMVLGSIGGCADIA